MDNRRKTRGSSDVSTTKKDQTTRRVGTRKSPSRKSPARKRSPSPVLAGGKSPARKRSPSPVLSKSPAREPRKRTTAKEKVKKEEKEKEEETNPKRKDLNKHFGAKAPKLVLEKFSLGENVKLTSSESTSSITTQSTATTVTLSRNFEGEEDLKAKIFTTQEPRTLTPATEVSVSHRSISRSVSQSIDDRFSHAEFSDNEEPEYESYSKDNRDEYGNYRSGSYSRRSHSKQLQEKQEFGGNFGALCLIFLLPLITFGLNLICTNKDCSEKAINLDKLKSLSTYINVEVGWIYLTYTFSVALLASFPLGRIVKIYTDRGLYEYYFNGFSTAVLVGLSIAVVEYFKYPVIEKIYKNYQQLCFISLVYALIISMWCYIRSKSVPAYQWNPYGKSGKFFADFFIGREISPYWFQLIDIKLVHYRISLITTLILNGIFIYKNVTFAALPKVAELSLAEKALHLATNIKFNSVALLTAGLLVIYILDLLFYEHHLTSSFELQGEGVGALLLLRYAAFPFSISLISKYSLEHKLTGAPSWALALIAIFFLAGVIIKRSSNKLKYEYRLNPVNPKLIDLETLPTFQGRRLIISKSWGIVRHPNYTGDILSLICLLSILIWGFAWPPLVANIVLIGILVHRTIRVNARNYNRYDSAWTRYCSHVRYRLIPKVF